MRQRNTSETMMMICIQQAGDSQSSVVYQKAWWHAVNKFFCQLIYIRWWHFLSFFLSKRRRRIKQPYYAWDARSYLTIFICRVRGKEWKPPRVSFHQLTFDTLPLGHFKVAQSSHSQPDCLLLLYWNFYMFYLPSGRECNQILNRLSRSVYVGGLVDVARIVLGFFSKDKFVHYDRNFVLFFFFRL